MKSASAGTPIQIQVLRSASSRLNSEPRSELAFAGVPSVGLTARNLAA